MHAALGVESGEVCGKVPVRVPSTVLGAIVWDEPPKTLISHTDKFDPCSRQFHCA